MLVIFYPTGSIESIFFYDAIIGEILPVVTLNEDFGNL